MLEPIDIAIHVHQICIDELIPKGISPEHGIEMHAFTTRIYADAVNGAGVHATGEQVTTAILEASGWDRESQWPGHPSPDLVVAILNSPVQTEDEG